MAIGRISGQLLQDNLTRAGTNLAFETNLLYLDVNNNRIGIKTIPTQYELEINGTTRTTNLEVTNSATIANVSISGNTIQSTTSTLSLLASGLNSVVYNNRLTVGNISLATNIISGTVTNGNIEIQPNGLGKLKITGDTEVYGSIHATGNITADGNITLGNSSTDTVTFDAEVSSDIIPSENNQYSLGTASHQWANVWTDTLRTSNITPITPNADLTISSTGSVIINDIAIHNSTISSTGTDENIILSPSGNGLVKINSTQSLILPYGDNNQRPVTNLETGMIRFNTEISSFEGWQGSYWTPLGGIRSVDGQTRITPELTLGAGDNVIRFYTNNVLQASLDSTALTINQLIVNNLTINNSNVISSTAPDSDLTLSSNGAGAVVINNFKIANNTISNSNNAIIQFVSTGNGYFSFSGTNGVVIPAGVPGGKPTSPVVGMIRFNTVDNVTEMYDGTQWVGIAGTASGITQSTADSTAATMALIFG
jgi:hypothetical protein